MLPCGALDQFLKPEGPPCRVASQVTCDRGVAVVHTHFFCPVYAVGGHFRNIYEKQPDFWGRFAEKLKVVAAWTRSEGPSHLTAPHTDHRRDRQKSMRCCILACVVLRCQPRRTNQRADSFASSVPVVLRLTSTAVMRASSWLFDRVVVRGAAWGDALTTQISASDQPASGNSYTRFW
jgi:hypothetical protein